MALLKDFKLNRFSMVGGSSCNSLPVSKAGDLDVEALIEEVKQVEEGYVVIYTLEGVRVIEADQFNGLPQGFLEMRAFDANTEIHVVDSGCGLRGRIRRDCVADGQPVTVVDEAHVLWGAVQSVDEGNVILSADRGTRMELPMSAIPSCKENDRVALVVRNYLDGDCSDSPDVPFYFGDNRFVAFAIIDGKEA